MSNESNTNKKLDLHFLCLCFLFLLFIFSDNSFLLYFTKYKSVTDWKLKTNHKK